MTEDQAAAQVEEDDIESWLSEATPDEVRVPICMNRALLAEFDGVIGQLAMLRPDEEATGIAMMDGRPELEDPRILELQVRLQELKALIVEDEKKHTFILRKCDRKVWRKLLDEHPPTKEQVEKWRGLIDHDPERAAPAMVAACCAQPKMDTKQVLRLRDLLPDHVFSQLYNAAIRVNRTGTEIPKSVMRTVDLFDTERKLTSPANGESPSANSTGASQKKASRSGRSTT